MAAWVVLMGGAPAAAQLAPPSTRVESVRGLALGSGVRASAMGTHAQADNPANLVRGQLYHLELFSQHDTANELTGLGGAVVDSMTSKLAAGFSARGVFGSNGAGKHKGFDGRLALAYPFVPEFSVGIAVRYANMSVAYPYALDQNVSSEEDQADRVYRLKHLTMDTAATLTVGVASASFLAYNLVDTKSVLAPRQLGGSLAFTLLEGRLTAGGDLLFDLDSFDKTRLVTGGGVELLAADAVPLRLGYIYDQGRSRHAVTGGLGYVGDLVGLQAGLRQYLGEDSDTNLMFVFQCFIR